MSHSAAGDGAETADPQGGGTGQPNGDPQADPQAAQADGGTPEAGESVEGQLGEDTVEYWRQQANQWKANSRKNESRARENSAAAKELEKIKQSQLSEVEKAELRAAEAERRAEEVQATHNRMMAAAMHDLPVDAIDFLGTGTEEEISERAESLASIIQTRATELARSIVSSMGLQLGENGVNGAPGSASTAQAAAAMAGTAGRPVESMRAGAIPSTGGAPRNTEEMFRAMLFQETE